VWLGIAALAGSTAALAGPAFVTYPFTVTATSGPLSGDTEAGSFTYSVSVIPPGGGIVAATGLLTDLSFSWDGIPYDASTANTGLLNFNSSGQLSLAFFGTTCSALTCESIPLTDGWFVDVIPALPGTFEYTSPTADGDGSISLRAPTCTDANLA